jgi:DNA-binding response OmpR family regulator
MEATSELPGSPIRLKRILVVDDDAELRGLMARKLSGAGFEIVQADSAHRALELIRETGLPHLAVVDINMPGMNGLEFCQTVQQYADLPVILVTAINESSTTIKAIELYAEDYIVKPFNLDELVVRVQRLLRRIGDFGYVTGPTIAIDEQLAVNFARQQLLVSDQVIDLTPIATKILYILWRNRGRVVTNEFLLGRIWPGQEVYEETLRVHVHRLRHKLEGATGHKYILTERGQGYRLDANPANGRSASVKSVTTKKENR